MKQIPTIILFFVALLYNCQSLEAQCNLTPIVRFDPINFPSEGFISCEPCPSPTFSAAIDATSAAIRTALESPTIDAIVLPPGTYEFNAPINITGPKYIIANGPVTLKASNTFQNPSPLTIKSNLINITSSCVTFDGNITFTQASPNTTTKIDALIYIGGSPITHINNVNIINCKFIGTGKYCESTATANGCLTDGTVGYVTHGINEEDSDWVTIQRCSFQENSAHAVFMRNGQCLSVHHSDFTKIGWSSVNFNRGVNGFGIYNNTITSPTIPLTNCITHDTDTYIGRWGGSIDLMGQGWENHLPSDLSYITRNGRIFNNDISGQHGYGAVMRIASAKNIFIFSNKIHDCFPRNFTDAFAGIRVLRRSVTTGGVTTANPIAGENINIYDNSFVASIGSKQTGISVTNDFASLPTVISNTLRNISIYRNTFTEIKYANLINNNGDSCFYFRTVINIDATDGGIEGLEISNNRIDIPCRPISPNGTFAPKTGISISRNTTTVAPYPAYNGILSCNDILGPTGTGSRFDLYNYRRNQVGITGIFANDFVLNHYPALPTPLPLPTNMVCMPQVNLTPNYPVLQVNPIGTFQYIWNTGNTTNTIYPYSLSNTYTVTVTNDLIGNTCTAIRIKQNEILPTARYAAFIDNKADISATIYPNPSTSDLNIVFKNIPNVSTELYITNTIGQITYQQTLNQNNNDEETNLNIPTQDWESGMYFIGIRQDDKYFIKKWLKL